MLSVSLLFLVAFLFVLIKSQSRSQACKLTLFVYISGVLLFLLQVYEFQIFSTTLYKSDELTYIDLASKPIEDLGRFFWIAVNKYFYYIEPTSNVYLMKLVNIPLLLLFLFYTSRLFGFEDKSIYLLLLAPYLVVMAASNLRDVAILLSVAMACYYLKVNKRTLLLSSWGGLLFLRPVLALFFVLLYLCIKLYESNASVRARLVSVFFGVTFLSIAYVVVGDYLIAYWEYYAYVYANEGGNDVRGLVGSGIGLMGFFYSLAIYVFTPMPFSLLGRIIEGGSEVWGMADDVLRFFNQFFYYIYGLGLLFFFLFKNKVFFERLKGVSAAGFLYIYTFLLFAPIYTVHLSGITHQRLKIPFQLALLVVFIVVLSAKKGNDNER